nr:Actin cross-linking toxin VgrG1 [Paraburkholderia busanensis]
MSQKTIEKALRAGHIQFHRLIKLDTPLGDDWLLPLYVKGTARLGRNYEVLVDAVSPYGARIQLASLLKQPVTLWIQQNDETYLPMHGYVQAFRRFGSDGALTYYQLRFSSWLSFLKLGSDRRDWLEVRGEQILSDVFGKYAQARGQYRFELRAPLRAYSQRMQWESDWHFVQRSFEELGLFTRFEFAADGKSHQVVIADDLFAAPSLPQKIVHFSHSNGDEEFDGLTHLSEHQTVQSAALETGTFDYMRPDLAKQIGASAINPEQLPAQSEIYDYTGAYTWPDRDMGEQQARIRVEEWASSAKRLHGVGGLRCALPGYWFTLDGHPAYDTLPDVEREFAIIGTEWLIQNNIPGVDALKRFPAGLRGGIEQARTNGDGSSVRHVDGSVGFFRVEIEAQARRVPFRSPFEHGKPVMQLQSGIVAGPKNEEVHTDEMNRHKVRLTSNRRNAGDGNASAWIRAAAPDAGAKRGGIFTLRTGDEVLIGFVNGDCDRPVIVSRLHGGATRPVWNAHGLLSGFRSKEYGGAGFNQLVMDDSTGQNRLQLHSTSYSSHLHLGYLISQTDNTRGAFVGSGFDLKSDAYGAVRATQGMYLSTQPAAAQPLNVSAATEQLAAAEAVLDTVSEASAHGRAASLADGHDALKHFTDATRSSLSGSTTHRGRTAGGGTGHANGFAKPLMLMSSPAGIAMSTQQSAHVAADGQINVVSGKHINLGAGKSLLASVLDGISLFAQNLGVKIFAAKGPVIVQAQSDAMTLIAQQDVTIESVDGRLVLTAKNEVWIGAGGSYIRIGPDLIENGTRGEIRERCASWGKSESATMTLKDPLEATSIEINGGRGNGFSG